MALISFLGLLALVVGGAALKMAIADFKSEATFRLPTAVMIYSAWGVHALAFAAAVWRDPYRVQGVVADIALFVGSGVAGVGLLIYVLGANRFRSFGQLSGMEVGGLLTRGVYSFTRHPQYAGWIVLFLGISIAAASPLALLLTGAMAFGVSIWIPNEERHLLAVFGDDYRRYAEQVPGFMRFTRAN